MATTGIKQTFGKLKIDEVKESQFKKGIYQAQLRQTVTTTYPGKVVGNSESDSLFDLDDFNLPDGQEFTTERLAWIDVPAKTTVKQVETKLKASPNAKLYRKISHDVMDILTEQQKGAINAGITSVEDLETSKIVKDSDGTIIDRGNGPEYRQYFLDLTGTKADIDYRTTSKNVVKSTNKMNLTA